MRALLPIAFVTLAACDTVVTPPPPDPPPAPDTCRVEGQLYGPCTAGEYEGTCAAGLSCIEVPEGSACLPVQDEPSVEVQACAATIGALACSPEFAHLCFIVCPSGADEECGAGTVCDDQYRLCVWPSTPPPDPMTSGPATTSTSGGPPPPLTGGPATSTTTG
jgi:hypothetical protein